MTITIALNADSINNLDLSPALMVIDELLPEEAMSDDKTHSVYASYEQQLRFDIDYPLEPGDPRELSEIPELRLWFVRLDAKYPWLPFLLDWKAGELARYTAMLVPHQFSSKEGIQYNPEALEIFLMHKIFILSDWLKQQNLPSLSRLKYMAQMFGYELDDALFERF
ncbi:CRR6 family NdhI maturation factor [Halotia wernerae UHCC 0503]|nr:CRR6 family NdhI maturation factor [Halotia wernerae UHCC 0503]